MKMYSIEHKKETPGEGFEPPRAVHRRYPVI